ncbi:uncharacterized protein LOC134249065 isoform X2 [Saccostrea cucullata]
MDHLPRVSEILYAGLCQRIGSPSEVAIRRDVQDMVEMVMKPYYRQIGYVQMKSGSYGEGFRLRSSDLDLMFWFCHDKLIVGISQAQFYNTSKHDIILMEDSDTPPGFVRLRLLHLSVSSQNFTEQCLLPFNDGLYISSSLWRERNYHHFSNGMYKFFRYENLSIHGPCASGFLGPIEFDYVFCFATTSWPISSRSWIDRCQEYTWPLVSVLEKILRNGFHCMPTGSKIESTSNELEWRISFSLAEQQLVYTMNRTQFLCYALLKIFLKEVINHRREPLLCSYFIKTTIFWKNAIGIH